MNSEKVKEIKTALEFNAGIEHHDKLSYIDGYKCKVVAYADILTLINEMESENERLRKERDKYIVENKDIEESNTYANEFLEKYKEKNKNLKDRIAELKKENARLDKVVKHNQELIENGKLISSEQLKQFVESLKEKIQNCSGCYIPYCFESPTNEFAYSEIEVNKAIDKTLKEFLNK